LFLFAGIWAKKRFKLPFLLEINSPIAEERSQYDGMAFKSLAMKAQSHVWRQADVCLPVTAVLSQYLIRAGVPQDRIEIIHNGINLKHFANLPDGGGVRRSLGIEGRIVLGFTGFVRTWHGLDKVIRWMARGQRQDIQLLVVGEGPAREELEELARQVNLADRISFTGLVHRDRVPEYVAAFDVALQPAVVDYASPLKLFEYLALGRAVIAPCKPNLMEVLQDDVNALLFETDREGAFEAGLSRLCEDAALRARLGEAARRTIQDGGYTWQANAMRITSLFERLRKAGPN
jgi:glycosyltransferase involved in cell wall biosynthesis